jgi:hypothetical protein
MLPQTKSLPQRLAQSHELTPAQVCRAANGSRHEMNSSVNCNLPSVSMIRLTNRTATEIGAASLWLA